ncbi:MAG: hypothetical protein J6T05_08460 [Prevotella sp.]|nr:hypothetical protein [Prevotella sp.]
MKKLLSKYWPWMLTLMLGITVWLFWAVGYPHALAFREQFQLFLLDGDYFCERMALPGGLARWIAEFLTQFFNNPFYGATMMALLFMLIQRQTWLVYKGKESERAITFYPLTFIPAILLWYGMGDEMLLLAYPVALLMVLTACWFIKEVNLVVDALVAVVGIPLLYWLAGPLAFLAVAYMVIILPQKNSKRRWGFFGLGVLAVVLIVLCIAICGRLLPYPVQQQWVGIGYYRLPLTLTLVMAAIPVAVIVLALLSQKLKVKSYWLLAVSLLLAIFLVPSGFDAKKYEIIDYDYLVRTAQWKKIIQKAERQHPDLPMSVAATNLALAMENQLGERAFQFFQRGTQGLVPPFERNYATTMMTGEIYFRLGLVNTAQRYAFEAMEAIPNYDKSVRVVKRLAETNLINGQYEVARKYLHLLEKTLFYRRWAQEMLAMLGDEAKINSHPLYGYQRLIRLPEDQLFSEKELDKFFGKLFLHNQQNEVAMQYLLMWPLLNRDIPTFMDYVGVVQNRAQYNPLCIQEGICFAYGQKRTLPPEQLVSNAMTHTFAQFAQAYNGGQQDPVKMQAFKGTVWYYLVNEE